jgi:uncharacterized protein (TIGR00290 family)
LWTGGKDCALALYETRTKADVVCLATFVPERASFKAHPLAAMKKQARALGLPHVRLRVRRPYRRGYREALERLRKRFGVETLVTGDIDRVDGKRNWIRECAEPIGLRVLTPLWGRSRRALLEKQRRLGFRSQISYVNAPLKRDWIGRVLDRAAVRELAEIEGVDLCGENGEYHTMVTGLKPLRSP